MTLEFSKTAEQNLDTEYVVSIGGHKGCRFSRFITRVVKKLQTITFNKERKLQEKRRLKENWLESLGSHKNMFATWALAMFLSLKVTGMVTMADELCNKIWKECKEMNVERKDNVEFIQFETIS